jgi:uncharacterized protein
MATVSPLRAVVVADQPALLRLNNDHATELNFETLDRFSQLLASAAYSAVVGPVGAPQAFLLAFDHQTPPQGPNHAWFLARSSAFLYVDRVCVAPAARKQGLARALYEGAFEAARARGIGLICCEVNTDPPNPGSDAFHAALGFVEVGRRVLEDRGKAVRYLQRRLLSGETGPEYR